jgi:hypothetical protein
MIRRDSWWHCCQGLLLLLLGSWRWSDARALIGYVCSFIVIVETIAIVSVISTTISPPALLSCFRIGCYVFSRGSCGYAPSWGLHHKLGRAARYALLRKAELGTSGRSFLCLTRSHCSKFSRCSTSGQSQSYLSITLSRVIGYLIEIRSSIRKERWGWAER